MIINIKFSTQAQFNLVINLTKKEFESYKQLLESSHVVNSETMPNFTKMLKDAEFDLMLDDDIHEIKITRRNHD